MSLIQYLNSYLLNDIANIVYDYHFDFAKVVELKKKLLNEYQYRISYEDDILYYNLSECFRVTIICNYKRTRISKFLFLKLKRN